MDWREFLVRLQADPGLLFRDERSVRLAAMAGLAGLLVAAMLARLVSRRLARRTSISQSRGTRPLAFLDSQAGGDWGAPAGAVHGVPGATTPAHASSWPIDRLLPRRITGTLSLAIAVGAAIWLAGLSLAPSIPAFLGTHEWQFQPLYIATHIVALRLFVHAYTRGFMRGVVHLDLPEGQVRTLIHRVLGWPGLLAALAIAIPFAAADFRNLNSPRYERLGGKGPLLAIDYLNWGIWCAEWLINAFIWVVIVGFLIKTCWVLRQHRFRAPIEIVLHDRHYKPFLQMSAQGASIVLIFTLVTLAYIVYTDGELTDYIGLMITAALLLIGFVPSLTMLRAKVRRAVEQETLAMRHKLLQTLAAVEHEVQAASPHGGEARSVRLLEHRLDAAVAILRISYLENRNQSLGQTESRAILVRMLAPALSIGWQAARHVGDISKFLPPSLSGLFR